MRGGFQFFWYCWVFRGVYKGGCCTGPRSSPRKRQGIVKVLDDLFRGPNWWASRLQLSWHSFAFSTSSFGSKWDSQPPYEGFGVASALKSRRKTPWKLPSPRFFGGQGDFRHALVLVCLFHKFCLGPHPLITSLDKV